MQLRVAIAAVLLAALCGCGLFDSGSPWSSGKFEVLWIDTHSSSHLAYRIESSTSVHVVDSCVIAAGANDLYVVVERLAPGSKQETYYVVNKGKYDPFRYSPEAVIGPLSEAKFVELGRTSSLPVLKNIFPAAACNGLTTQSR